MVNFLSGTYTASFAHTITSTYGTKGSEWLSSLPTIIQKCSNQWKLTDLKPYPMLTYNYVMFGMMNSTPIILKLRCNPTDLHKEVAALEAYNGYGSAQVLAHDLNLGAMILERALPGETLASFFSDNDQKATTIAADCIRLLHQAPFASNSLLFQSLEQTVPDFKSTLTALDPFIKHAQELKKKLLTTEQEKVLLHGDFHQGNILSSAHENWIVIDPEGIIGDPIYDLAVYIRNPLTELLACSDPLTIINNRITTFATTLGYEPQRIYDWTYLQAVSSAYWSLEDGLDITRHVAFLKLLEQMDGYNKSH